MNSVVHAGWSQAIESEFCFWTFCITLSTCDISNWFPDRFARGQDWHPPNSPDLDPCDYFLWEFLKEKVFPKELKPVWNCCQVISITIPVEVSRHNGSYIEHLIHR
jgi:hypothetical protein